MIRICRVLGLYYVEVATPADLPVAAFSVRFVIWGAAFARRRLAYNASGFRSDNQQSLRAENREPVAVRVCKSRRPHACRDLMWSRDEVAASCHQIPM